MELGAGRRRRKKNWNELGVVDTIYEEEEDDAAEEEGDDGGGGGYSTASSPSLPSPALSPAAAPRAGTWSAKSGCRPDVVIRVQGTCFHLHKAHLTSRSAYLKRHLTGVSELTLSPPLKITAATFRLVADFCSGGPRVAVTPFNVAGLATAAASLEMTAGEGGDGGDDLRLVAETYFRQYVAASREYASILFRSCLGLLPEAETAARLVSRCVEAFGQMGDCEGTGGGGSGDDGAGDGFAECFDDVVAVGVEDFQVTVDSMQGRLTSHDLLYRMVDVYLMEHGGKMTEERKAQICNTVDCTKLSMDLLLHAVQNPRMPLRFVVRAMLVEQLRTRLHVVHARDRRQQPPPPQQPSSSNKRRSKDGDAADTLGTILQRDAAVCHGAQLKAAMEATSSRIQSLERELTGMRRTLRESTSEKPRGAAMIDSARSASFHYITAAESSKIERGERGSVSSVSYRFSNRGGAAARAGGGSDWPEGDGGSPGGRKSIRQRLISGLKHAFGVLRDSKPAARSKIAGGNVGRDVTAAGAAGRERAAV
ncbi:BTB/POZ domain-containing protein At3g49900 [Syzygium oleosum]|uniref:BTB/POZ domain-containing protein At3g49900 n=1 Tax=Syzygium oleosum TaxID=219896 RepID=UPI0024BB4228|nr:BTB/POZ domain-containing protein At3g49900 [Syzygium oleosum]